MFLIGCISMISDKQVLKIVLCVGLLQIAGYYLAGSTTTCDASMAVAQPDTLLYCQAARRIAEGHPFSFSHGEQISTGTTSVLYPFLLSVPYALGMKGDALIVAGFVLNALFYILFIWGWCRAFFSIFERPIDRLCVALLLALSSQPAYCALAQSDIGLWLAVSGLFAAAFFQNATLFCFGLLVIGPWVRPEGMVLVVAFCVYAAVVRHKIAVTGAMLGVLSSLGVFALNYILTGTPQFSSVANKGYFSNHCFPEAVYYTATDMIQIIKGFALGLSELPPRIFFMVPVFGAALVAVGVVVHKWRDERGLKLGVFLLAALGGFATVSMSGWQNTNIDRYLAWITPLVVLFLSEGAIAISSTISDLKVRKGVAFLPVVYAACASIVMFFVFHSNSHDASLVRDFGRQCEIVMPRGASVGGFSRCGVAYDFSDRRFAHLSGIYSPEFNVREPLSVIEILKHEPETRFDYWIYKPDAGLGPEFMMACSESVATGPIGWELRKSKWDIFGNLDSVQDCVSNMHCVARVDVGYEKDEKAMSYRVENRYERMPYDLVLKIGSGSSNGQKMIEVARMVAGLDEMNVPLEIGKDAKVVMRTFSSCKVVSRGAFLKESVAYEIANPARLNLSVNGVIVGEVSYSCSTNGFSDVVFSIPKSAITASPCSVAFLGDHITCGYWFYQ